MTLHSIPPGTYSGSLPLVLSPADLEGDPASLVVVFRTVDSTDPNGDSPWNLAAITFGSTSDLSTDAAGDKPYDLLWDTTSAPNGDPTQPQGVGASNVTVQVKARAFDNPGGAAAEFGSWTAAQTVAIHDENLPPVAAFVSVPTGIVNGSATLTYTLFDAQQSPDSVLIEMYDGSTWLPAEASPLSGPTVSLSTVNGPVTYSFIWNATQLGYAVYQDILLRLTPYNTQAGQTITMTTSFTVDNTAVVNQAPTVVITGTAAPSGGRPLTEVQVSFVVSDSAGAATPVADLVNVAAQFWNGSTWLPATIASVTPGNSLLGLSAPPAGDAYQLTWNAVADLPGLAVDTSGDPNAPTSTIVAPDLAQQFRLVPTDTSQNPLTGNAATVTLNLGNAPPIATLSPIGGAVSGQIPVQFTLADSQSDLSDVVLQFRQNAAIVGAMPRSVWVLRRNWRPLRPAAPTC